MVFAVHISFLFKKILIIFPRNWTSMIAFIKEIWIAMGIQAYIFREVDRNVMDVGYFTSATGI